LRADYIQIRWFLLGGETQKRSTVSGTKFLAAEIRFSVDPKNAKITQTGRVNSGPLHCQTRDLLLCFCLSDDKRPTVRREDGLPAFPHIVGEIVNRPS
jgi:hypothetical protein